MTTLSDIRQRYPQYSDVDDATLADALYKKFYSDLPRDDFDKQIGLRSEKPTADKYTTAALEGIKKARAAGVPSDGTARLAMQGMTFNAGDEILAGLSTPLEMISQRTFNPAEGYRFAKAKEDALLNEARENSGYAGMASELVGGVMSGAGLAGKGVTAARFLPKGAGLLKRTGASIVDSLGLGTTAGFMEGNSLEDRASNAVTSGAVSGLFGALAPVGAVAAKAISTPILGNIRAWRNPKGYAQTQVARGISESGMTPQNIADDVSRAASEGQPMYTLADAMGNPGQRMLSTATRAPGPGRTMAVDFLENRQAGQGKRVANALIEGFDTPATAEKTRTVMTGARDRAADAAFTAARNNAGPVDLTGVIQKIDDTLSPGVNQITRPASGIANDSIESSLEGFRRRMTDNKSMLTDFVAVQRVRGDLSDAVQAAKQAGNGNKARMLGQVLGEIDASMENASSGYRQANRNFAKASQNIDMIDEGGVAAKRGRTEDIIPRFRSAAKGGQEAYRAGYVDPLVAEAQGGAFGVNKARPLTSDAFKDESAAIAPMRTQPEMMRRVGRENTMFATRANALGGSKTADNLADAEAMSIDPAVLGGILSGDIRGAARAMLNGGYNLLSGNTPGVRAAVAKVLLQNNQGVTRTNLQRILDETISRIERARRTAMLLSRGSYGGVAIAGSKLRQQMEQ